ncbi:helix-turn-helix domain-containing protein [Vibrio parahaemolyticus]|uniref:helix-turn-helix domain-containing protein n=1 Tax=Vibrio parahaemolyticus TaxID=670 RepID=UPI000C868B99|nr:helix-turn-helix transcriptional regulator [Vibrio parahaemolyticus]MBE3761255.1 helix-turn-helix transcriptional regulator [Vibrio parahaemolyticus]MDF4358350.1 helix-turn-helix transcriptional regulator [Vibrio parahaemolyticus]MDG2795634.1 helix-turn-helix transcriptional regulator [Vibrio parahaemolyticus]MDK9426942.1 helix-turn-helix transcriptional regulator [Vibrio parahaemolyticus]MDK9434260.1 helix-turn-helix transcriptional regulator [Vibrio parahaemolyticus]
MSTNKKADAPNFGLRLKSVRARLALNQSQMAAQIGVSKDTLSRYERGELTPSIDVLKRIVENYSSDGVTADSLLLDDKPKIPSRSAGNVGWATGFDFQNGGSFEIAIGFNDLAKLCETMTVFTELNIPLTDKLLDAADALRDVNEGFDATPTDMFLADVQEIDVMSYLKVTVPIAQQAASLTPVFIEEKSKKDRMTNKYLKEVEKVKKLQEEIDKLKRKQTD